MTGKEFAEEMLGRVRAFCQSYDARPPAYSYVPLKTDEQRIKVMKSRLFNEVRSAEIFGGWLKSTPELDVKATLAEAVHEEMRHAALLEQQIRERGAEPYDYRPLPAQMAMFNAFEGLTETVERMAAFPMAGEGVADYMIVKSLRADSVPEWIKAPYRAINEDEETHGNYPAEVLTKHATTPERQERVRRAVEMSLMLRRQYFENLDRWVFEGREW
ncbi:MAG: hypothetical protein HYV08_00220 [Deltaproteobacteria bacterium]|nr:hypothetical protein [Deltaproteobacteria bacterium]